MRFCSIAVIGCALVAWAQSPEVRDVLESSGQLSASEIAQINSGKSVAKILSTPSPDFIYVLGATYIRAFPEDFLRRSGNVDRLRAISGYLDVGRFSDPPSIGDLKGFELEPDDLKELRNCRPGKCEVQLPGEAIELFRQTLKGRITDARAVNARAQEMALEAVERYRAGGSQALGAYHDRGKTVSIAEHFAELLGASNFTADVLPELRRYLIAYPRGSLPGAESFFYWERVEFGLKPTLRINHAVSYRTRSNGADISVFAAKQLYASHYFQAALDLSVCLRDPRMPASQPGFYLISLKGSRQAGLTGIRGSILRRIVTSRTRTAQAGILKIIKDALEGNAPVR